MSPAHATPHDCLLLCVCLQLSIRLLAVKGITSHDVIMTCLSHDIIVVDRIGMEKLVHLSDASGSEILCYAQHAEEVGGHIQHFQGFPSPL